MTILFLTMALFCFYTYVLFPVAIHCLAKTRPVSKPIVPKRWPSVSVVIAMHNEEHNVVPKYENLKKIQYEAGKLQFVIVSDGSTDGTNKALQKIASQDKRVVFYHYDKAAGKPSALNEAVKRADGDILVFMDARQKVSNNAVKVLVGYLQNNDIGAVSGELVMADSTNDDDSDTVGLGLYWAYEKWIRSNESRWFSTTGATGALYAIHKSDYQPHAIDVLLDDFDTPVRLLEQGKRTVLAPNARVFDKTASNSNEEFARKVRTLAGNFQSFSKQKWLFNPVKNPVWWQFLSHKVFRLLVPYAMITAFAASAIGSGSLLNSMFWLQIVFYSVGVLVFFIDQLENSSLGFIKVFLQLNLAAIVGAYHYFTGKTNVRWKQS